MIHIEMIENIAKILKKYIYEKLTID